MTSPTLARAAACAATLLAFAVLAPPAAAQERPKQDHDAAGRATAPTVGDDAEPGRRRARPVDTAHPRPALDEIPVPPGRTTPPEGREPAPLPRGLDRNDFVADRFTAPGQSVEYAFEARAGELSILEIATWGYQRSWNSVMAVRILGPDGRRLAAARRAGETAYRCFLPFAAPEDGVYRVVLESVEEFFRYTLVRHSDYPAATGAPVGFAERAVATDDGREVFRGYLASPDDTRRVRLDVEAGEELALSVLNDHPMGRRQKEIARKPDGPGDLRDVKRGRGGPRGGRGAPDDDTDTPDDDGRGRPGGDGGPGPRGGRGGPEDGDGRGPRGGPEDDAPRGPRGTPDDGEGRGPRGGPDGDAPRGPRGRDGGSTPDDDASPRGMGGMRGGRGGPARGGDAPTADFPDLVVTVRQGGEVVAGPGHFVLFTPATSGTCEVEVTATSRGEGGLFALELDRAPARVAVSGYVGDEADDPVPGVTVTFFRQPGSDPVGESTSDADGEFALTVLPGDYVLRVRRDGEPRTEHVQVNIPRAREVNLVWATAGR